jgi:hypothetical protein
MACSQASIERLHGLGVALIISVDCGIRGVEAAARARALGLDLIITDHHEPDTELPQALAVINPKRHDCSYPDKNLAGVGVCAETGASAVHQDGAYELASRVRQGRGDRHSGRCRPADRRKPCHRQARPRDAVEGAAQGGVAITA